MRRSRLAREAEAAAAEARDEPEERPRPRPKKSRELHEKAATIPHDPVNEQVVIAAAIVGPKERAKLVRAFLPEHFFGAGHATLWRGIVELERRGLSYDPAAMKRVTDGEANTDYLDAVVQQWPVVAPNLAFHVECMHWDKRRVEAARGPITNLLEALQDPTSDPEQVRRLARMVGNSFDGGGSLRYLRDPEAVLAEMEREIDERVDRFRSGDPSYPYGMPGLDFADDGTPRLVPGAAPQQLTLVVGASGAGKTTFTNQVVLEQIKRGRRVIHGAWEQGASKNLQLLAAFSLKLSRSRVFTGALSDEEKAALKAEGRRLQSGPRPPIKFFDLPFDQTRGADKKFRHVNESNLDVIHEHVEMSGCDVAIFDLFHQALVETKPEDEKRALDRMQGIAKATNAHLVLLHHLNKADLASRADKRPTRDSIRGGTHWINAFDTIFGLHIPGVWKNVPMDTMEVHVLKQRYGKWPLAIEFDYDAETGIVSNGRSFDYQAMSDGADEDSLAGWLRKEDDGEGRGGRKRGR